MRKKNKPKEKKSALSHSETRYFRGRYKYSATVVLTAEPQTVSLAIIPGGILSQRITITISPDDAHLLARVLTDQATVARAFNSMMEERKAKNTKAYS